MARASAAVPTLLTVTAVGLALACEPPADPATPGATQPAPSLVLLESPAGPGALAPNLTAAPGGRALLSWLEPREAESSVGHVLRMASVEESGIGAAQDLAAGSEFFANWADLPAVAMGGDGVAVAHWLEKLGQATYAYGAQLAAGPSWQRLGLLHDDASPTEHGFVSYAPVAGGLQAFWLDGRKMIDDPPGDMELRTTFLKAGHPAAPSQSLDERVCECCATDAALTADGPVVVYRDRSDSEIRDIAVVRATADGWSEPALIHGDGWQIHGCPVNGPAIAADGDHIALAWFTAAKGQAKVQVVHSTDGGATFGAPVLVDDAQPLGRVDIAMARDGGAVVSWLGSSDNGAEIRWRPISADGVAGPVRMVSTTSASRSAGVPRMIRRGDELLFVWVEDEESARLRAGLLALNGSSTNGES